MTPSPGNRMTWSPDLSNGRAIVTGGASGIGRAVAHRLAAAGAHITVLDRDEASARAVVNDIGGTAIGIDLTDAAAIGHLDLDADILVNGAGVQHVAPIEDFDLDKFTFIQRLMVEAPFLLTRAVLPAMYERQWGRIIHISSIHGHRASAYKVAYVAAKHALEGLSKVIAIEGAAHGVTSNTVAPGYVRTPLVEGQIAAQAEAHGITESEVIDQVLLARTPVRRLIEVDEVAEAVSYLCSPAARSITGSSLMLDGGWHAG